MGRGVSTPVTKKNRVFACLSLPLQHKLRLARRQARRVLEILQLRACKHDAALLTQFRLAVKQRLAQPHLVSDFLFLLFARRGEAPCGSRPRRPPSPARFAPAEAKGGRGPATGGDETRRARHLRSTAAGFFPVCAGRGGGGLLMLRWSWPQEFKAGLQTEYDALVAEYRKVLDLLPVA